MRTINRFAITLLLTVLGACAATPEYNPTLFNYELSDNYQDKPVTSVIIAHVNLGGPSRNYLAKHEKRIDAKVAAYLKANGIKVIPQRHFSSAWNTAVRAFGNPVDPTTGRVNRKTFAKIMLSVRDHLQSAATPQIPDAILFTDLIEFEVTFSTGLKHLARWDGVTRKPAVQGPGNSVSTAFDWGQPVKVASLMVSLYDMSLQPLFVSRGGLSATEAVDTRSSDGGFVRRRNILSSDEQIAEGIALAFHPVIPMRKYPGK